MIPKSSVSIVIVVLADVETVAVVTVELVPVELVTVGLVTVGLVTVGLVTVVVVRTVPVFPAGTVKATMVPIMARIASRRAPPPHHRRDLASILLKVKSSFQYNKLITK